MPDAASQPEAQARRRIDALLEASGWTVQDRSGVNLSAGAGVALRELPTSCGETEVERRFSVLDQVEATVQTSLARCGLLRQAILKRAFGG